MKMQKGKESDNKKVKKWIEPYLEFTDRQLELPILRVSAERFEQLSHLNKNY